MFYLDVAYVFTHMLQVYIPVISYVLDVCCIQMFFILQVFYVVRPGASRGPMDGARGAPGGSADRGVAVRAR